jgi:hypothetical protein
VRAITELSTSIASKHMKATTFGSHALGRTRFTLHSPVLVQEVRQHGAKRSLGVLERRVVCDAHSLVQHHVVQNTARCTRMITNKALTGGTWKGCEQR